jgi:hypothetical protein
MPSVPTPLRLTREDFDAYLPERAFESAATRTRLLLGQRMLDWGRGVARRLANLDLRSGLSNGGADTQRLALVQGLDGSPDAREGCAELALVVSAKEVFVALELPASASLDQKNLRARLSDPERNLELRGALEALPEQFTAGLAEDPGAPAALLDGTAMSSLLDRSGRTGRTLRIGWSVPCDVAVVHSTLLDEQLGDAMVALAPVYRLVAWAADNDLLAGARVRNAGADHARSRPETERDQTSWEERSRARRLARATRREEHAERTSSRKVEADGKRRREPAAVSSASRAPPAEPGRPRLPAAARGFAREVDSHAPIERGARVRVLAGPFVGKVGIVQELDGKGGARVMLGLLATSVKVQDLVASVQGKGRPTLSSSHRKRLPAR